GACRLQNGRTLVHPQRDAAVGEVLKEERRPPWVNANVELGRFEPQTQKALPGLDECYVVASACAEDHSRAGISKALLRHSPETASQAELPQHLHRRSRTQNLQRCDLAGVKLECCEVDAIASLECFFPCPPKFGDELGMHPRRQEAHLIETGEDAADALKRFPVLNRGDGELPAMFF